MATVGLLSSDVGAGERAATPPLVVHVLYRFDVGGLENGVVNLINHMPPQAYRHAVVALTEVAPTFQSRILDPDVACLSLHKPPGQGLWMYPRLVRLFRTLRPAIVHTRNLAAMECQAAAWWAGVPGRIHGEHGRDIDDLEGKRRRYQWMRKAYCPFVHRFVGLSEDLVSYLRGPIGIPMERISHICNGVDATLFSPPQGLVRSIAGCPFGGAGVWVIGTVGRMQAVKSQTTLARAFVSLLRREPALRERVRLVMVGEGPLRAECQEILDSAGLASLAWLPGERSDVHQILQALDCFVLPSLAEGISNTILEAMATGLPVVATRVGGNAELVVDGETGQLVPSSDVDALAESLAYLATHPYVATRMGGAGRQAVERKFSMEAMVAAYRREYDGLIGAQRNH